MTNLRSSQEEIMLNNTNSMLDVVVECPKAKWD
jgi:hypothetical protein